MSKENSKVKIGARVLSQTQLDKLLPNNDYIFKTIDIIRKHAHQYKQELGNNKNKESIYSRYLNRELDRNYNNVFSILGDRGSGKTSVLLTIKNKLMILCIKVLAILKKV